MATCLRVSERAGVAPDGSSMMSAIRAVAKQASEARATFDREQDAERSRREAIEKKRIAL